MASKLVDHFDVLRDCEKTRFLSGAFVCLEWRKLTLTTSSGIPKKFLVGSKRTWDLKLSPGLPLCSYSAIWLITLMLAASPLLASNASVTRKCCSNPHLMGTRAFYGGDIAVSMLPAAGHHWGIELRRLFSHGIAWCCTHKPVRIGCEAVG